MEDYEVVEQIGRGSFSATFLVVHRTENKRYVLKKISISKQTEKFKRAAHQELNVLAKLRHPYILEYKDVWFEAGDSVCIITSYCEHGNIHQVIRRARGAYFPEEIVCKWLTQMLLAIDFIHSNRVLHGNLKLSNVFLTRENDICLGDFGLSKLLDGELACPAAGTPNYVFPELLAGTPYGYKSDIWSLGCCVFEIAAHQQAFKASDMAGLVNKINRSLISPLPIIYSPSLKQIIKSMLRKSMEHRPAAAELLRLPHLQPFLLRCHDPSPTFLPVKSPSPKNTKEKKVKTSPTGSRLREVKQKPKDLLPLFDENKDMQLPSLLEGDISFDDILETKRVDRTSYSGKISTDSEDSKSAGNVEDDTSITYSSSLRRSGEIAASRNVFGTKKEDAASHNQHTSISPSETSLAVKAVTQSCPENDVPPTGAPPIQVTDNAHEKEANLQERAQPLSQEPASISKSEQGSAVPQRADALESLLELCAELLKEDKLDELTGILKPFGDEMVSSRETAIWLTKTLMKAKKMARDSS